MSPISHLPPELLTRIAESTHPSDSLAFALANKAFYECIKKCLSYYRQKANELRLVHDREPLRLVELLRLILLEPHLGYFVRTFEVWAVRTGPDDWTWASLGFNEREWPDDEPHEPDHDYSSLVKGQGVFGEEEIETLRSCLKKRLGFGEKSAEQWLRKLQHGDDQPLKLILMALCPHLETIIYVNKRQMNDSINPFKGLDKAIRNLYQEFGHGSQWPCLQHVQSIVTGISHPGMWTHGCCYHPAWSENASLFLLPSVDSLIFDMTNSDNIGGTYNWKWPAGCSNVKRLTFDANADGDAATFGLMSGVSGLRSIKGFNWRISKPNLVDALNKHQLHLLDELDLESFHVNTRMTAKEMLAIKDFTRLRTVRFSVTDFITGAFQEQE